MLDTNAAIAALGDDAALLRELERSSEWLLPSVVLGELFYGAYGSTRVRSNLSRISDFVGLCTVVAVDQDTALFYGRLRTELRFAGRPIPSNDAWIASLCRQHSVPLLSRDRHFDVVEGLQVVNW
ncbi:MAG TPA: type II toxin-antitoxin system VapC family toxin [Terriglobales bacterium]|nr:type II toxin-antitoxin system VapC family toxin [Terriglobales bacterium]